MVDGGHGVVVRFETRGRLGGSHELARRRRARAAATTVEMRERCCAAMERLAMAGAVSGWRGRGRWRCRHDVARADICIERSRPGEGVGAGQRDASTLAGQWRRTCPSPHTPPFTAPWPPSPPGRG